MTEDLKIIKKLYGEKMMHFCRSAFSTILEKEGLLPKLLQDNFAPSHELYNDLVANQFVDNFKSYIYAALNQSNSLVQNTNMTPKELLKKAGYILHECKTEEEIQAFRKYYAKGEALCTFNGCRLNSCYVFFAVKENVDEINRVDFTMPNRQDLYGTSVISIQFTRDDNHTLSIKNRYNHTVANPDATFGNDLEQIIPGLTDAFERTYGLVQTHKSSGFELSHYVKANDGKFYKYNYEDNNIYYCPDNIIIDNFEVKHYAKERFIVLDFYIIDLVEKKIYMYNRELMDSFPRLITDIDKIAILKDGNGKIIEIVHKGGEITTIKVDRQNRIIELESNKIVDARAYFLWQNKTITRLSLPELKITSKNFVESSRVLSEIYVPKLEWAGDDFLYLNEALDSFEAPNLTHVGNNLLRRNIDLKSLKVPKLISVGDYFLFSNESLNHIDLPMLEEAGDDFLYENKQLKSLSLPSLKSIGSCCLYSNTSINNLDCPNLKVIKSFFLFNNLCLKSLNLPNVEAISDAFLQSNATIKKFIAPKLSLVGSSFMKKNNSLESLSLPCLEEVYDEFLLYNESIRFLDFPSLKSIGHRCLLYNPQINKFNSPCLKRVGANFLFNAKIIDINAPNLRKIGLYANQVLYAIAEENINRTTRK